MRFQVTSETYNGTTTYYILDTATDAKVGTFDCEKWAERIAEVMEEQHKDDIVSKSNQRQI